MKTHNINLSRESVTGSTGSSAVIRMLRSLGYDVQKAQGEPSLRNGHGVRNVWQTTNFRRLQCRFFELDMVTETILQPLFAEMVRDQPWNLVVATADYNYLLFAAVAGVHLAGNLPEQADPEIFPSVRICRVNRRDPTPADITFLTELTCTSDSDQEQFSKILYAFHPDSRTETNQDVTPDSDLSETDRNLFFSLRRSLQPHRQSACSGSWVDRRQHLILPVFQEMGLVADPGRITQQDMAREADYLLYDCDPETPGATPVAACLCADPYQSPLFAADTADNRYGIRHAKAHAQRLLHDPLIRKVFVTDGRIWHVYYYRAEKLIRICLDLFRVLRLDSERVRRIPGSFRVFLSVFNNPVPERPAYGVNEAPMEPKTLLKAAENLLKTAAATGPDMTRAARILVSQLLYILYCEANNLIHPVGNHRWNIPELTDILMNVTETDAGILRECVGQHLLDFADLDTRTNQASMLFSQFLSDSMSNDTAGDDHVWNPITFLDQVDLDVFREFLTVLGHFRRLHAVCFDGNGLSQASEFCSMLERECHPVRPDPDSRHLPEQARQASLTEFSQRLKKLSDDRQTMRDLHSGSGHSASIHLLETLLRFHVVDSNTGFGPRLADALHVIETLWLNAFDHDTGFPPAARIASIRETLVRDAFSNRLLTDINLLTDSRLIRLLCAQHCLYGLAATFAAPSCLLLATGLTGIRFPFIAHHFTSGTYPDAARLSRRFEHGPGESADIPVIGQSAVSTLRWLSDQEYDWDAFGPDFAFARSQFTQAMDRIRKDRSGAADPATLAPEIVFPWIFYNRLSGVYGGSHSGTGFDCIIM